MESIMKKILSIVRLFLVPLLLLASSANPVSKEVFPTVLSSQTRITLQKPISVKQTNFLQSQELINAENCFLKRFRHKKKDKHALCKHKSDSSAILSAFNFFATSSDETLTLSKRKQTFSQADLPALNIQRSHTKLTFKAPLNAKGKRVQRIGAIKDISRRSTYVFHEGDYYIESLDIESENPRKNDVFRLKTKGKVRIFLNSDSRIVKKATKYKRRAYIGLNRSGKPSNLLIFAKGKLTLEASKRLKIKGFIYAYQDITLTGNKHASLRGAVSSEGKLTIGKEEAKHWKQRKSGKYVYAKHALSSLNLDYPIEDSVAPVITLNGEENITITLGESYEELGARAIDNIDGNISVSISGEVNTSAVGTYELVYSAEDSVGNEANLTRVVEVIEDENEIQLLTLLTNKTKYTRKLTYYGQDNEGKVIYYYAGVPLSTQVFATFEDGEKEEVTDKIEWVLTNNAKIAYGNVVLTKEGTTFVQVQYQNITSNTIEVTLENYEENSNNIIDYIIYDSNTPKRGIDIEIELTQKPLKPVTLVLELDPKDKVEFKKRIYPSPPLYKKTIIFKAGEKRYRKGTIRIEDKDENSTSPYVIKTHILESEDTSYDGKDPQDIRVVPNTKIELITPPIEQRRGALRGVHINMLLQAYATWGVEFRLVNPPKGMYLSDGEYSHILDQEEMLTKRPKIIEWNVPMDAIEGKTYDITVEVTDAKKRKGSLIFPIKVPKTTPIQTQIVNNELTVTDKKSNLYGMKMKGHSGEDIFELKLRAVDYGDVWRKNGVGTKTVMVFVLDNMPEALDVKFPEYIDNYKKRKSMGVDFLQYAAMGMADGDFWDRAYRAGYSYDGTKGLVIPSLHTRLHTSNIFILITNKSQERDK